MAVTTKQTTEEIDVAEARQALEKILSSKHFVHAYKKKKFLELICDFYFAGKANELNEYILAYDVFERDNSYNPSTDPIVRVVAHDIRKKLEVYYQNEGATDSIRLELPIGGYQPVFVRDALSPAVQNHKAATALPDAVMSSRLPRSTIVLGVIALGLLTAVIALALSNRALRQKETAVQNPASYGKVWEAFLKEATPPIVVLSNPMIPRLAFANEPEVVRKDVVPLSPEAKTRLREKIVMATATVDNTASGQSAGKPVDSPLPQLVVNNSSYTGLGEAIGLHYVTNFFHQVNKEILLKQSRTLSAEDLRNRNVIMLGGAWVNEWSGKLPNEEDFIYSVNTIVNRNPRPGEEREYLPQFDPQKGNLVVDYALITVKPNLTPVYKVLVLSGIHSPGTEAAVEFVTDKNYREQLNQRLQQEHAPNHFQVLLKVGAENGIPTTISILAVHKLP